MEGAINSIGQILSDLLWFIFNLPTTLAGWLLKLIPSPGGAIFEGIGRSMNTFFLDMREAIGVWAFVTILLAVLVIGWRIMVKADGGGALRAFVAVLMPLLILQGFASAIEAGNGEGVNAPGSPAWLASRALSVIQVSAVGNLIEIGRPTVEGGLCERDFEQAFIDTINAAGIKNEPTAHAQMAIAARTVEPRNRHVVVPQFGNVKAKDRAAMRRLGVEDAWCQFANRYESAAERQGRIAAITGTNVHSEAFPQMRFGFVFLEEERMQVLSWAACQVSEDGVTVRPAWAEDGFVSQSDCNDWVRTGEPAVAPKSGFFRGTQWPDTEAGRVGKSFMQAGINPFWGIAIFIAGLIWLVVAVVLLVLGLLGPIMFGAMVVLLPATLTLRAASQLSNNRGF